METVGPTTLSSYVSSVFASGNTDIDSLLWLTKWGGSRGTGAEISYSFVGSGGATAYWSTNPNQGGYSTFAGQEHSEPWSGWYALREDEKAVVRSVLATIEQYVDIKFVEVPDTQTQVGHIRYAKSEYLRDSGYAGLAYSPGPVPRAGDVWFAPTLNLNPTFGDRSGAQKTILHETLHALGLKHPFGTDGTGVTLPPDRDILPMTVMSYSEGPGYDGSLSTYPTVPMPIDVSALQYLYGPSRSGHVGDDVYRLSSTSQVWTHIWDPSGTDTIVVEGSRSINLDLRPNSWSQVGPPINIGNGRIWTSSLFIDPDAEIESATAGSGNDTITGNDANNSINGGAGNDTLYGGAGNDTFDWDSSSRGGADAFYGGLGADSYVVDNTGDTIVEYSGEGADIVWASVSYSIAFQYVEDLYLIGNGQLNATGNAYSNNVRGNSGNNVIAGGAGNDTVTGGGGNDVLGGDTGIDTCVYTSSHALSTVARTSNGFAVVTDHDGTDTLNSIERLRFTDVNVALDASGVGGQAYRIYQAAFDRTPDLAGLGYWIAQMDGGMSTVEVAARFIDSTEFRTLYGTNPPTSQVVTAIYNNVLHRVPDQAGHAFYVNQIDTQQKTLPKVLADFSESPENQLQVLGQIENGFEYLPWAA